MAKASRALSVVLCALLASCGGGGGGGASPASINGTANGAESAQTKTPATPATVTPTPAAQSPASDTAAPPAPAPIPAPAPATPSSPVTTFAAGVTSAPLDGTTISGTVTIMVAGSAIQNVELLPETGYTPLYARGTVSADNTTGIIQFDTRSLPDGPVTVRVTAFNVPPGQSGSEITAMTTRTWTIKNTVTPAFSATLINAPPDHAFLQYGSPMTFVVSGNRLGNVELVSANDIKIQYGRFTISADKTSASLTFTPTHSPPYGSYNLRVLAWDVPPGQAGQQIEVMSPRLYYIHLALGCYSVPGCGDPAP